jgi:hypothetical protein
MRSFDMSNSSRWLDHYGFKAWDVPTLFGGLSS